MRKLSFLSVLSAFILVSVLSCNKDTETAPRITPGDYNPVELVFLGDGNILNDTLEMDCELFVATFTGQQLHFQQFQHEQENNGVVTFNMDGTCKGDARFISWAFSSWEINEQNQTHCNSFRVQYKAPGTELVTSEIITFYGSYSINPGFAYCLIEGDIYNFWVE